MFSVDSIKFTQGETEKSLAANNVSGQQLDLNLHPQQMILMLDKSFSKETFKAENIPLEKMYFMEFLKSGSGSYERKGEYYKRLLQQIEISGESTVEPGSLLIEYIPTKRGIIQNNLRLAKNYLSKRLKTLLLKHTENELEKTEMIEKHGVVDYSEEQVFKLSYRELEIVTETDNTVRVDKIRNAQESFVEKRYDLYLLDLSVINRYRYSYLNGVILC